MLREYPSRSLFILLCLLLLAPAGLQAQYSRDSVLSWSADRKLVKGDFRYFIQDTLSTHVGYGFRKSSLLDIYIDVSEYDKEKDVFTYNIFPVFFRYQSWLHDTTQLAHEQLHFDISEVYARRMRRCLLLMKENPRQFKHAHDKLQELYTQHEQYQAKYDRETSWGRFPNMQIFWERNISVQLDTLKKYAQPRGVIKW